VRPSCSNDWFVRLSVGLSVHPPHVNISETKRDRAMVIIEHQQEIGVSELPLS